MKFPSLTLVALAGMLISAHALPEPLSKPEISTSQAEADVEEIIPSINATEHGLSPRGTLKLMCYTTATEKWAADGRVPIREDGKNYDLKGKNLYDVAGKFCYEKNGYKFSKNGGYTSQKYWFKNALKTFPLPFVPVTVNIVNADFRAGTVNAKFCADMMVKVISGCTAKGRPSRFDHFIGGEVQDSSGWTYAVLCDEGYCMKL
ncbi:hypothetical protein GX51_01396 [Blastomyces parvus]|uniref:Ecp2 effector protein domain-containing protein n=1 Tax=Blastomyces parvus TaxID=2060905 RepID=A0A2B7XHR3_9EURO|nr:hypothetical protein GX51_01396 [Blastomyces parvus]